MPFASAPSAALGAVSPADVGRASGANGTFQRFGGAFGIAVATAIFGAHGTLLSPAGFVAGMRPALAAAAVLATVGAAAALAVGGRLRTPAGRAQAAPALAAAAASSN
jgi:hypothetical protein